MTEQTVEQRIEQRTDTCAAEGRDGLFRFARYDDAKAERIGYSHYSYWRSTWRVFTRNRLAMFCLWLLCLLLTFTFVQPFLPGQRSSTAINNNEVGRAFRNLKPNGVFWFGTNSIGQDLWARIWSGTRTSLFIGLSVGLWDALFGVFVGSLWGYVRRLDRLITELYNVASNIPNTIIMILAAYVLRPGVGTVIFAMCLTGWLPTCRYVRNQIVIIRDREFNLASRCLGTPTGRIITKNLLPQLVSVIMMRTVLAVPLAIGQEVFLTYIGLGLPVSIPSLGNLINEGRIVMMSPSLRYQLIFPASILSLITIAFYVIGNAFADAADPRNHL
ncbi:MAG: ABC transporter permease [Synergistaceae bacterium]|jgi:oligopeptide transport system permease protein|nr:ABC transporter permease [Synergistaceae bacterium]